MTKKKLSPQIKRLLKIARKINREHNKRYNKLYKFEKMKLDWSEEIINLGGDIMGKKGGCGKPK